jgi:phospholipid/cholesterol/gamma-HCH transport system substrate-binding protein
MAKRPARDLTVGVVVSIAILVLAVAVMTVGEESQLFATKTRYQVVFPTADGLRLGSPVRMAGVLVGSVEEITLPTDPEAEGIEVTLGINSDYAERVRENSVASLRYLQLLSGEKFVDVTPGDPSFPPVPAGASVPTRTQAELLEQSADIAEKVDELIASLQEILGPLQRGEGLLGRIIHDPEFGTQAVDALTQAFRDLETITGQVRSGEGFVGRMLFDEEFAARLDELGASMDSLSSVLEAVGNREGAIGALIEEDGAGEQAIEEIRDAAASLKRTSMKLESEDGLIGKLSDPEYAARVSEDMEGLLRNLREITDKINRGEGTLGALVNSRTVYEGMEEIVAGVNDSGFARWLMRRYQTEGIKAQEKAAAGDESEPAPASP